MTVPLAELPTELEFGNVVLSGDGRCIAGVTKDDRILSSPRRSVLVLWDWTAGNKLISLRGTTENINSVKFSHDPSGRYIVTASGHNGRSGLGPSTDNSVRIWDRMKATGPENPIVLKGHASGVVSASFSADNRYVVSFSDDGVMKVWDWRASPGQQLVQNVTGITQATVSSVTFSPDNNNILAAGGAASSALLWRWNPKSQLKDPTILRGHANSVISAVFSPDGKFILTSALDGTERIWNTNTGQELAVLNGHETYWGWAQFIDANLFIVSGPDGTAIYECDKCTMTRRLLNSKKR